MSIIGYESYPYHRQNDKNYCAVACAQMCFDNSGVSLEKWTQESLFSQLESTKIGALWGSRSQDTWATTPSRFVTILNSVIGNKYQYIVDESIDKIKENLKQALTERSLVPFIPYNSKLHWITIFKMDERSSAFTANSPVEAVPVGTSPPYHGIGDKCRPYSHSGRLGGEIIIAKEKWQKMKKMATFRSIPYYVAVIPISGTLPPLVDGPEIHRGDIEQRANSVSDPLHSIRSGGSIFMANIETDYKRIQANVRDGLLFNNVYDKDDLQRLRIGQPLLVRRLDIDNLDDSYYVISTHLISGETCDISTTDMGYTFLDSFSLPTGNYLFINDPARDRIINLAYDKIKTIAAQLYGGASKWTKAFNIEMRKSNPTLVWKPCRESISHFYPFFLISPENLASGEAPFYVRIDGEVFPKLTD